VASALSLPERQAAQIAAVLLFVPAVVTGIATASFILRQHPQISCAGIGIAAVALAVMPLLAWAKRREARRSGNSALAADAVQSATCAYLALITLCGLAGHAIFGVVWFDPLAALIAVPILVKEGKDACVGTVAGVADRQGTRMLSPRSRYRETLLPLVMLLGRRQIANALFGTGLSDKLASRK